MCPLRVKIKKKLMMKLYCVKSKETCNKGYIRLLKKFDEQFSGTEEFMTLTSI